MLIVPYTLYPEGESLWTLWVFLTNGTSIWETDEEICSAQFIVDNYLTPNGLSGKVRKIINGTLYFELDDKIDINNFYTWGEFLDKEAEIPKTDLFRPFFWVGDTLGKKDQWGWYEECEEVSLGKMNLAQLWIDIAGLRDC